MNQIGANISFALFCLSILAGFAIKYYYDKYGVENFYLGVFIFIMLFVSGILFVFFHWDTVPAGEVIYKEQVGMFIANLPIIILMLGGALMFLFLIPLGASAGIPPAAVTGSRVFGVIGLLIVASLVFGKTEIIMMKDGFTILDPAAALRNKIFGQKAMGYSSLGGYSLEKNVIHFYLKGASLPYVGYLNTSLNFTSENPGKIVEILKSKGVKDLNNSYE